MWKEGGEGWEVNRGRGREEGEGGDRVGECGTGGKDSVGGGGGRGAAVFGWGCGRFRGEVSGESSSRG